VRGNFPQDDTLFLAKALSILSGDWLDTFNQTTLLRGPMFPLWIAFINTIGIPFIQANDLLYLTACLVAIAAFREFISNKAVLFLAFSFLYLSPHSYDFASISHAFRQTIYPSLALLVLSTALVVITRATMEKKFLSAWSLLLGFSFSFFWYTREEGIWLVPALLLLLTGTIIIIISSDNRKRKLWYVIFYFVTLPAIVFAATSTILSNLNNKYYGSPIVLEIKTPEF